MDLRTESLNELTREAAILPAGAEGLIFLPYLAGELHPLNDGFARGVFFGLTPKWDGPFVQGCAGGKYCDQAQSFCCGYRRRCTWQTLIAVGGPTRNALLCQIIADVTGLRVQVMNEYAGSALGSAILAAQAST